MRRPYNLCMGDSRVPAGAWRLIVWIMLALVAWGVFHAVGAWRLNNDVRRLFVVLACVAAFLGFWGVLLAAKWRRLEHHRSNQRG